MRAYLVLQIHSDWIWLRTKDVDVLVSTQGARVVNESDTPGISRCSELHQFTVRCGDSFQIQIRFCIFSASGSLRKTYVLLFHIQRGLLRGSAVQMS